MYMSLLCILGVCTFNMEYIKEMAVVKSRRLFETALNHFPSTTPTEAHYLTCIIILLLWNMWIFNKSISVATIPSDWIWTIWLYTSPCQWPHDVTGSGTLFFWMWVLPIDFVINEEHLLDEDDGGYLNYLSWNRFLIASLVSHVHVYVLSFHR